MKFTYKLLIFRKKVILKCKLKRAFLFPSHPIHPQRKKIIEDSKRPLLEVYFVNGKIYWTHYGLCYATPFGIKIYSAITAAVT